MFGATIGARIGSRIGTRIGLIGDTTVDPLAGVTKDATSGWYVPASSSEWTTLLSGTGIANPSSLWLCQEASGNLADSIGALTLTATTSPQYQQAWTGWTRNGVAPRDNSADRFTMASGTGPNPSTTSVAFLFLGLLPATPAGNRCVGGCEGAITFRVLHMSTGKLALHCDASVVSSTATFSATTQAMLAVYDRTDSTAKLYLPTETITATYSASVTDGEKGIGNQSVASATTTGYAAMWSGANAEISATKAANLLSLMQNGHT